MPICLQVADNFVNGIPFKRKLGKETALSVWLSRKGMGHLSKTEKNRPCRVCCWVLGEFFALGLVVFLKGTICTFLSCLSTQQPDNLTCNVPLEGKGQIWLSLQTGKSNHRLVATVKV